MAKKWFLKKQSWKGPAARSWRVRDDVDTDLKAAWSDHGQLSQITLPFQSPGDRIDQAVDQPVDLIYDKNTGFYRGSIHDGLLLLLEVKQAERWMRGIFYSLKEAPVPPDKSQGGGTDPEPIGLWGAEEREGNEWPPKK